MLKVKRPMAGRGPGFQRLAPPAIAAAVLLVAVEADLSQALRDALVLIERSYAVAFFDAAKFRFLCP